MDQRTLARAADSRDASQCPQGNPCVDVFQVVECRVADLDPSRAGRETFARLLRELIPSAQDIEP